VDATMFEGHQYSPRRSTMFSPWVWRSSTFSSQVLFRLFSDRGFFPNVTLIFSNCCKILDQKISFGGSLSSMWPLNRIRFNLNLWPLVKNRWWLIKHHF
jgi:hypothetical protein